MEETGQLNDFDIKEMFHDYFTENNNKDNLNESISLTDISPSFINKYEHYENIKSIEEFFLDDNNHKIEESEETEISRLVSMINQSVTICNDSSQVNKDTDEIFEILKKQPKTTKNFSNDNYLSFKKTSFNKTNNNKKIPTKKISMSGRVLFDNSSSTTPLRCSHPAFQFEKFNITEANKNIFKLTSNTQLTTSSSSNNESMK